MDSFTYTIFYYDGESKFPINDGSSNDFKIIAKNVNDLIYMGYEVYIKNNNTLNLTRVFDYV